jgi:hypothetical protein
LAKVLLYERVETFWQKASKEKITIFIVFLVLKNSIFAAKLIREKCSVGCVDPLGEWCTASRFIPRAAC